MKKTRKFRLFTVLIALCILVGTIPAYAVNPYGSLTLTFTSEEDIDLGGIEISVYQAAPATVTETYTLYNETFHSTVTTDQNGSVTFAKPSQYCSITVELDSLPDGVGITKQTKFFNPDVTEETIILATVDRAETELSGTEVKPTFYSADNVQLLADYEVVKSNNAYATMPWESINAMDSFALSGAFVDGNMSIPYSIPVDISEANVAEKYTTLYDYGMISEREMILAQCDILSKPENSYMRTPEIVSTIEKYRDKLLATSGSVNSETVTGYGVPTINPDLALVDDVLIRSISFSTNVYSNVEIDRNEYAIVYSELPYSDINILTNEILAEIEKIYLYFVITAGLNPPYDSDSNTNKVKIYIIDDLSEPIGSTSGNRITINYSYIHSRVPNRWKTTLAHEYQHAIQNTYTTATKDSWISESTANFASAMYAANILGEYATRFEHEYKTGINAYLNTTNLPLNATNSNLRQYSILFPAYLYLHTGISGWRVIEEIYETSFGRMPSAPSNTFAEVDEALRNINSPYSLRESFKDFAIDNLFPKTHYGLLYDYSLTSHWLLPSSHTISASTGSITSSGTISEMGIVYKSISNVSDDELTLTIDVYEGNHNELTIWTLVHNMSREETTSPINPIDPVKHTMPSSRITIQHYHGSPEYPFTVIAINTDFEDDIRYSITVNN